MNNSASLDARVSYQQNTAPPQHIYTTPQYYGPTPAQRFTGESFVPSSPSSVGSGGNGAFTYSSSAPMTQMNSMHSFAAPYGHASSQPHHQPAFQEQFQQSSSNMKPRYNNNNFAERSQNGGYSNGGNMRGNFGTKKQNDRSSNCVRSPSGNKYNKNRSSNNSGFSSSSSSGSSTPPQYPSSPVKKSKKDFKKPEVPTLPKMSDFERRLRRVRVLYGIGKYNPISRANGTATPSSPSKSSQPVFTISSRMASPSNVNDLFEYLIECTMRYRNQEEFNKTNAKGVSVEQLNLKLELAYCRDAFTHVFNVLSMSSDVVLSKESVTFLSDLSNKAENAVMRLNQVAGTFTNQHTGVTSQVLDGRWKQRTIPLPIWQSVPALRCVFLPLDSQDGPQEVEIRPYPRTKRDLEQFFEQRGSFRATNQSVHDSRDDNLQLQFFVVTRKRPVIAFRTSQGQTPFTKSNKLTEKWINDIRVKKFFGPVLLLKVVSHDPDTDELEIEDYTMEDFDRQISTNFSLEELIGVKMQLKQDHSYQQQRSALQNGTPMDSGHAQLDAYNKSANGGGRPAIRPRGKPVSNFELDVQSLQQMEAELCNMSTYDAEDWTPFFRGVNMMQTPANGTTPPVSQNGSTHRQQHFFASQSNNRTPAVESNLVLLLKNVLITSLSLGAFVQNEAHYIVNTNIPIAGKSKYNQLSEEGVVYAVLSASPEAISSINSCVFGGTSIDAAGKSLQHRSLDDYESYHSSSASTQVISGDNTRLIFELVHLGTWSQVVDRFLHDNQQNVKVEPPQFCTAYMAPLNMKKKNMQLSSRLAVHVASNPQQLPSRLLPLSSKELKHLFSSADAALEKEFQEETVMLTPALIQNALKFLIPLQITEDDESFVDGAIVLERTGTHFLGTSICSTDEAYVAVRSISGNVELPWIHNISSYVLTLNNVDTSSVNLERIVRTVCQQLKADVFYQRVDIEKHQVELLLRHVSGRLNGYSALFDQDGQQHGDDQRTAEEHRASLNTAAALDVRNEFNVPHRLYKEAANMIVHQLRLEGQHNVMWTIAAHKLRELKRKEFQRVQM